MFREGWVRFCGGFIVEDAGGVGVRGKAERPAADNLVARHRRAPILLDVPRDESVAGEMVDGRCPVRIEHAVGQIADEGDIHAVSYHLADPERPLEDADVLMHTHVEDIGNAPLARQVEGLDAVGDGIARLDFNRGNFVSPWGALLARRVIIATTVQSLARQRRFAGGDSRTRREQGRIGFNFRGGLRQFAARGALVKLHRGAGAVDDKDAALAQLADDLIDARRQLGHAFSGAATPMLVPHVADDRCRLARLPLHWGLDGFPLVAARPGLNQPPQLELQRLSRSDPGQKKCRKEPGGSGSSETRSSVQGSWIEP
jgi:hypothetical protein